MIVFDPQSIKALRASVGMTQAEFAGKIGKQAQQVAVWEAGICQPNMDNLSGICNEFQVPVDFFFSETRTTVEEEK